MKPTRRDEAISEESNPARLEVFFDGLCPVCMREVEMVRAKDKHDAILFTDITARGFSPAAIGLTQARVMDEVHARTADGEVVVGVEVFRRMYGLLGFSKTVALSRVFGVRQALDLGYRIWARNRLRLTRRCDGEVCT